MIIQVQVIQLQTKDTLTVFECMQCVKVGR